MPDKVDVSDLQSILKTFKQNQEKYTKYVKSNQEEARKSAENIEFILKQQRDLRNKYLKLEYNDVEKNFKAIKNLQSKYLDERIKEDKKFYNKVNDIVGRTNNYVRKMTDGIDRFIGLPITRIFSSAFNIVTKFGGGVIKAFKFLNVDLKENVSDIFKRWFGKTKKPETVISERFMEDKGKIENIVKDGFSMVGKYLRSINRAISGYDDKSEVYYRESLENLGVIAEETKKAHKKNIFDYIKDFFRNIFTGIKDIFKGFGSVIPSLSKFLLNPSVIISYIGANAIAAISKLTGKRFERESQREKEQAELEKRFSDIDRKTRESAVKMGIPLSELREIQKEKQKDPELMRLKKRQQELTTIKTGVDVLASKGFDVSGKYKKELAELDAVNLAIRYKESKILQNSLDIIIKKNKVDEESIGQIKELTNSLKKVRDIVGSQYQEYEKERKVTEPGFKSFMNYLIEGITFGLTKGPYEIKEYNPKSISRASGSPFGMLETFNNPTNILVGDKPGEKEHLLAIPDSKTNDKSFIGNAFNSFFGLIKKSGGLSGILEKMINFGIKGFKGTADVFGSLTGGLSNVIGGSDIEKNTEPEIKTIKKLNANRSLVISSIEKAASIVGENAEDLKKIAYHESGLNPLAAAKTSSAKGLFQFIDKTWGTMVSGYGKKYPDIKEWNVFDPLHNSIMGAEFLKENRKAVNAKNLTDAYMAHFLGPDTANKFLNAYKKSPQMPVNKIINNEQVKANENIFMKDGNYRTLGEVYNNFERSLDKYKAQQGIAIKENKKDFLIKGEAGEGAIVDKSDKIKKIVGYIKFADEMSSALNKADVVPDFQMSRIGKQLRNIGSNDKKQNNKLEDAINKLTDSISKSGKSTTIGRDNGNVQRQIVNDNSIPKSPNADYHPMSEILPSSTMMSMMFSFVDSFTGGM